MQEWQGSSDVGESAGAGSARRPMSLSVALMTQADNRLCRSTRTNCPGSYQGFRAPPKASAVASRTASQGNFRSGGASRGGYSGHTSSP